MPTSTFFNLPQEKRNKLLSAIKDEFSRVPFDEVSINKIVHAAGIPRGSFYQYFTDKNDVLCYLLSDFRQEILGMARESMKKSGGDLFQLFSELLDFTLAFASQEQVNGFCRNLFADIRVNSSLYPKQPGKTAQEAAFRELSPLIDRGAYALQGEDECFLLVKILLLIYLDTVTNIFLNPQNASVIRTQYDQTLALLKRFMTKEKE